MDKDYQFGFTEVNQDFGRTNDTPQINFALVLDMDKKVIRIPYSNAFVLIEGLINNYTRITSNLKLFKQRPCLRVLQGKKKMQIADPKCQLISFCLNLKEVCFRVQDTASPNPNMSDITNLLSGEETAQNKNENIILTVNFEGKKMVHTISQKKTIKDLKEQLSKLIQKERKIKAESLMLQIDGSLLVDNKMLQDYGLEDKQVKMFVQKKEGCYRANTMILRSDGSYAAIKSIKVGDKIKTLNREALELEDRSVISIYATTIQECVMVKLKNGVQIYTTPNHMFMCEDGAFRLVKSGNPKQICLKQNDYLRLISKKTVEIVSIQTKVMSEVFYNVVTESGHNVIINDVVSHHFSVKAQNIIDKIVYAIDASPFDNFLKIKQKLEILLSVSSNNIKLTAFSKQLHDEQTISDKSFENQTIINYSKKSVEQHFNSVSIDTPILCKGGVWVKLNEMAQKKELSSFDVNKNTISNTFPLFQGQSPVKVEQFVLVSFDNSQLKLSTDSYLLTASCKVVFVMELYKAYSKNKVLPELRTADGQQAVIKKIELVKQKTLFYKVKTSSNNIIVSNLVLVKNVINIIIRRSGRITEKVCLCASKETTIGELKQKLVDLLKISVANQFLSYNGSFLELDQTLASKSISSSNVLIVDICQKIHQSSILFEEEPNAIAEDKMITVQFGKENVEIKYATVSDFTLKEVLKGYLRVEDGWSYVLIFASLIVYSNQKLKKLEESPEFAEPNITVIVIQNEKLSFLSAINIHNQKIRTFSSIIFDNQQQFKNVHDQSGIKVKIPPEIVERLKKAENSIKNCNHNDLFKKQFFYLPFLLFTSRKFNDQIYRSIRSFDQYRSETMKQTSVFSIIRDLYCNMNWLQNYQRICHYGLRNFRASLFFKPGHTFYFYSFTLAFKENAKVIQQLNGNAGTLFYIQSTSGKLISKFSVFPQKNEIMFAPFTYFLVQRVKQGEQYDEVWLTEVASPVTFRKDIILWVDDNPHFNAKQYEYFMHMKKNIEILQVTSTKAAEKWIEQFGWILGWKGLKFKLISDMSRLEWQGEKQVENKEAGIDLLELLYKIKGYSTKTLIFCGNQKRALQIAQARKIPSERYQITQKEELVEPYFEIHS